MKEKPSLYEILGKIQGEENLEIITVEAQGTNPVILRIKQMPEIGFLLWPKAEHAAIYTQLVFRLYDGSSSERYAMVSGKYPSEACGVKFEDIENYRGSIRDLINELKTKFNTAVRKACKENNITMIFVERAEAFEARYGYLENINVIDISDHKEAIHELYGRKKIRESLRFIDYELSRGDW